jgi:DNA helicase-2/ATP-dependent DNA helicase PcrA
MNFEARYKELNTQQKKAVDTIDGPVMVIAGPGTGKTSILTLRIANILKTTDTSADSILALTFTESGAYSMRKKLADIIGSSAYKVGIYTFHGFCNDIIKNYPEEFPRIIGANNISDIDQIKIIEKIIDDTKFEILKPYGDIYHYVKSLISEIHNLKQENISPKDLEKRLKKQKEDFDQTPDLYHEKGKYKGEMKGIYKDLEKNIKKNKELQKVYVAYEAALETEKLYDYQDMILEVIRAMESNKDLLLQLQEKYQYVLADEHQDANNSQNKILELISGFHENPNIFIVGDEKQAIFKFQGASLENFLYFQKLYPNAVLIHLEENYRSSQTILDASHSLIEKNKHGAEFRVKLAARADHTNILLSLYAFEKAKNELRFVAENIEEKIKAGVNPSDIAILYRENRDAQNIARALEKAGVPFAIESDQELFSDNDIAKIVLLMRAINDLGNDETLSKALFIDYLNVDYVDLYKVLAYAKHNKVSILDIIHSEKHLEDAKVEKSSELLHLYKKLESWTKSAKNTNLLDFFEELVRESDFLTHIMGTADSANKLVKLDKLFTQMKDLVLSHKEYRLADFINYLDVLETHNVIIRTKGKSLSISAVHLMTAHKSKGLEFEYVYMINLIDGHWGNKREMRKFKLPYNSQDLAEFEAIDDERRLFYVALTRAKKELILSYAMQSEGGSPELPSQFIAEIDADFITKKDTQKIEADYDAHQLDNFLPSKNKKDDIKDKEYLRKLFFEQGLSITALNNYLTCPWQYFFTNLIRVPQAPNKHGSYGTAVHMTLQHFFDKYKNEEDLSKKEFLDLFSKYLAKQPIGKNDFQDTLEKGTISLSGYYDTYNGTWVRSIINEFKIAGVFVDLPEKPTGEEKILLKGNLDKVEIMPDGSVNVVDYKTKKPMTRNDIEGKTKSSDGNYKRQLLFYKILLDNYPQDFSGVPKYNMETGEIDFIEPDTKGEYRKEKFTITKEDTDELKGIIQNTASEIANFTFWDTTCGEKDCEYCKLKGLMKI